MICPKCDRTLLSMLDVDGHHCDPVRDANEEWDNQDIRRLRRMLLDLGLMTQQVLTPWESGEDVRQQMYQLSLWWQEYGHNWADEVEALAEREANDHVAP
jgi:hypothetical protein